MNNSKEVSHQYGRVMGFIAWGLALVMLYFFFEEQLAEQINPNRQPNFRSTNEFNEVRLQRNRQGHYLMDGTINGYPVTFLLDTGATLISIPEHVAQNIGLAKGQRFDTLTANGIGVAYLTQLDSLEFGNIRLGAVSASINPNMPSDSVLLGMSVLKQLDFEQAGDQLSLRQAK